MATHDPLRGSCSCGRNQYKITIPSNETDHAQIYFDSSRDNRKFHGTPLTAWLRVPLNWYQSHTRSFFPDETHSTIRRSFTPHHAPHTKRIFCGFCGTPLTYWTEEPQEEAEYMSVTVGSLYGDDQRMLEDLNLLPDSSDEEDEEEEEVGEGEAPESEPAGPVVGAPEPVSSSSRPSTVVVPSFESQPNISRQYRQGTMGGIPWFEEMVEGSRLGRLLKARRGVGVSDDQATKIEWEFSEWRDDGRGEEVQVHQSSSSSSGHTTGKRKRGHQVEVEELE